MTDKLAVSLNAMKLAVGRWGDAADNLTVGRDRTSKVELGTSGKTFGAALTQYAPAAAYVRDRLSEGVTVFEDIASVLKSAHDQYETEELNSRNKLRPLEEQ
ncbi:hypothetical protein [Nocardia harenae]|uniref:hypothetical protein n=1 Tax=Nocardia harenae TaxID=358707 RepID=UPI00083612A2|nr:hypothetical protein [Nocardia harenae]